MIRYIVLAIILVAFIYLYNRLMDKISTTRYSKFVPSLKVAGAVILFLVVPFSGIILAIALLPQFYRRYFGEQSID